MIGVESVMHASTSLADHTGEADQQLLLSVLHMAIIKLPDSTLALALKIVRNVLKAVLITVAVVAAVLQHQPDYASCGGRAPLPGADLLCLKVFGYLFDGFVLLLPNVVLLAVYRAEVYRLLLRGIELPQHQLVQLLLHLRPLVLIDFGPPNQLILDHPLLFLKGSRVQSVHCHHKLSLRLVLLLQLLVQLLVPYQSQLLNTLAELELIRPSSDILLRDVKVLGVVVAAHKLVQLLCALALELEDEPAVVELGVVAACETILNGFLSIEVPDVVFVSHLGELHVVALRLRAHQLHAAIYLQRRKLALGADLAHNYYTEDPSLSRYQPI